MQIRTFSASSTSKLDQRVNAFLARTDIDVHRLHASMSFGSYMLVVEYDEH